MKVVNHHWEICCQWLERWRVWFSLVLTTITWLLLTWIYNYDLLNVHSKAFPSVIWRKGCIRWNRESWATNVTIICLFLFLTQPCENMHWGLLCAYHLWIGQSAKINVMHQFCKLRELSENGYFGQECVVLSLLGTSQLGRTGMFHLQTCQTHQPLLSNGNSPFDSLLWYDKRFYTVIV